MATNNVPDYLQSVYIYVPMKAPNILFAVVFLISGIWHLWQCYRYKAWKVMALHPFTCMLFVAGFALRAYGAWDPNWHTFKPNGDPNKPNIDVFIAAQVFVYFAPPILELANYHVFGRILYYVPYFAPIHPGRTLTTFGFLSLIVEILNALGVVWYASIGAGQFVTIGQSLLKASLLFQIVVIAFFLALVGLFHSRCARHGFKDRGITVPIYTMYASTLLILIRCVYRTIENFESYDHPTRQYEWYFLVFEASMMALNEILWNVAYPMKVLPERYFTYLAQDGKSRLRGKGWKDERNVFLTFVDPFGCVKTKGDQKPFWEENGYHHYLTGERPPLKGPQSSGEESEGAMF